jgi:hypothetical protein
MQAMGTHTIEFCVLVFKRDGKSQNDYTKLIKPFQNTDHNYIA